MLQFFLRARTKNHFKARSSMRDAETDQARVTLVFRVIDEVLDAAKTERDGLKSRVDDVLARAAVTSGNDSDEYLTRDVEDDRFQSLLNTEIANGRRRLDKLDQSIEHFQSLQATLVTRFPDFKLPTQPLSPN